MAEWFAFLSKWTLVPLAIIAIFEGVRRFSWGRSGRTSVVLLVFGIGVLGGHAGSVAWVASNIESTLNVLEKSPLPSLPESTLAQMTPQEREEKTRLLAQIAFENAGVLATYTRATGQQVRYTPSEKEIRDRQSMGESLAQTRTRVEFMRLHLWMFSLAVLAAAATGVYVRLCGGRRGEG